MLVTSAPLSEDLLATIDNIIFDFGGVLFDIDYDAPVRAFKELGGNDFKAIYAQAAQSDLFDLLETGNISNEDFYKELKLALNIDYSDEVLEEAWNTILTGIPKERIDLIYSLKKRFKTFIFSNTNAIHVSAFENIVDKTMGLDYFKGAFKEVHYSNVLGIKKPYKDSFVKYCELENLEPSRTLFIDDSEQHVNGADEAGLIAFHLDVHQMDVRDVFKKYFP